MTTINTAIVEVLDANDRATSAFADAMSTANRVLRRLLQEMPAHQDPEFMTLEQCAAFIHQEPESIYKLTHKHLIPFIKRGRKLLFEKARIAAWLRDHEVKTIADITGRTS